ncbi:hypothetical protein bcgnr5378_06300 [Bacillus cereus]|uniref:Uncharacterized protein n=1 Tax=Bacillus cereus TaxID=1396 RepID=A0A164LAJ1_BACCE|nr:hypothetical protein [Bacillus cereus]KZD55604.1 hypothetical protein B4088_5349 [Bacillus cereus]
MDICAFTDGSSYTQFVGKKSLYENKDRFAKECVKEFSYILEDIFSEQEFLKVMEKMDAGIVHDNLYCRYYPRMPEDVSYLDLDEGYLFCEKSRGAFEVFVIDIQELKILAKESIRLM